MRWPCSLVVILLAVRVAAAQPVRFELQAEVAVGHKPLLKLSAVERVTDVRLELDRDDGKHFAIRHAGLAKAGTVTLPIGDGAAGKAVYKGTLSAQPAGDARWSDDVTFETFVRAPLAVSYDPDHLDLDAKLLQFRPSRPAVEATLVVIDDGGQELGKGSATYKPVPAGTWLSITWSQPVATRVMMLKLRVVAADGVATNVELVPWSVAIEHEDVTFSTDSAVIAADETGKLDASLSKITAVAKRTERLLELKLFIAGHTDTVGTGGKNRKLSLARAVAIGRYFRRKGLAIPIVVAGYGEDVLKVKTADEVDEPANRRVDYVIGPAAGPPPFKGPYLKVRTDWKPLR